MEAGSWGGRGVRVIMSPGQGVWHHMPLPGDVDGLEGVGKRLQFEVHEPGVEDFLQGGRAQHL